MQVFKNSRAAVATALAGAALVGAGGATAVAVALGDDSVAPSAQVTVSIPKGGVGMVSCLVGEERIEKIARTVDGAAIKAGTTVMIDELGSDCLLVSTDTSAGWRRTLN